MNSIWAKLKARVSGQAGASMVEYAFLIILIAIIAFVAVGIAGREVSEAFSTIANTLSSN